MASSLVALRGLERVALGGAARVVPQNGGAERFRVGAECDERMHLPREADGGDAEQGLALLGAQRCKHRAHGVDPEPGILLAQARRRMAGHIGGLRPADRGRRFAGIGQRGQVDRDQRGAGGQGRGPAGRAPGGKPTPVAVIGAPGRRRACGRKSAAALEAVDGTSTAAVRRGVGRVHLRHHHR